MSSFFVKFLKYKFNENVFINYVIISIASRI